MLNECDDINADVVEVAWWPGWNDDDNDEPRTLH
jgi:hypothetical protein